MSPPARYFYLIQTRISSAIKYEPILRKNSKAYLHGRRGGIFPGRGVLELRGEKRLGQVSRPRRGVYRPAAGSAGELRRQGDLFCSRVVGREEPGPGEEDRRSGPRDRVTRIRAQDDHEDDAGRVS